MTDGNVLYLGLVIGAACVFTVTLMWVAYYSPGPKR